MLKARVIVTLKPSVLDPQGKAIEGALQHMGQGTASSIRQGKVFDIVLNHNDKAKAEAEVRTMCTELLANTLMENFTIQILD